MYTWLCVRVLLAYLILLYSVCLCLPDRRMELNMYICVYMYNVICRSACFDQMLFTALCYCAINSSQLKQSTLHLYEMFTGSCLWSWCMPSMAWCISICDKRWLDYIFIRIFIKIFQTGSVDVAVECQRMFNFDKISDTVIERKRKFLTKFQASDNLICNALCVGHCSKWVGTVTLILCNLFSCSSIDFVSFFVTTIHCLLLLLLILFFYFILFYFYFIIIFCFVLSIWFDE